MKIDDIGKNKCLFCNSELDKAEYKIHNDCIDLIDEEFTKTSKILNPFVYLPYDTKYINTRIGNIFDNRMPLIHDYIYETRISSYSEIANCDDRTAGDGDYQIEGIGYIDRDAGANIYDSYVNHNSNDGRDFSFSIINDLLENIKNRRRICMITGSDTYQRILQHLSNDPNPCHPVDYFGLHSYYITKNAIQLALSRIYFINIDDPEINEPWLHGKIRDLQ